MRKVILIFVALMIYAIWAAAQQSPNAQKWVAQFTAVPQGMVLATETPSARQKAATATWTPMPTYDPSMGPPSAWRDMPTGGPAAPAPSPSPTPTKTAPPLLPPDFRKK